MRLKCSRLGVSFPSQGGHIQALFDVSFESRESEFLSIVGPSGCGKTTLLKVLAGLIAPEEGVAESIPSPQDASSRTLLVFQEQNLFPWMTSLENAAFGLEMAGVAKKERESRASKLLHRFGLAGREHSYPDQLSKGMKQRVAIIRAFLSEPAILLMDEPFAALDFQTRLELQQELLDLWEQDHKSVIFVTHDIDEAVLLSDRVLVMSPQPGRIAAEIPVDFPRPRSISLTLEEHFLFLKQQVAEPLGLGWRRSAATGAAF